MSLFQKIDGYFNKLKKSEKILIYTAVFAVLGFISYQYLYPISHRYLQQEKIKKEDLEQKINVDRSYLQAMKVNGDQFYYVKLYEKKIADAKKKLKQAVDKKDYLDMKIRELSYLLYNKQKWAEFLNSITQKAYKNGVDIDFISNKFLDISKNFGHVLEIEIGCNGEFKDLVGFLNDLEESDLVVDVYALHMVGSMPTQLNFKVSVWGINY